MTTENSNKEEDKLSPHNQSFITTAVATIGGVVIPACELAWDIMKTTWDKFKSIFTKKANDTKNDTPPTAIPTCNTKEQTHKVETNNPHKRSDVNPKIKEDIKDALSGVKPSGYNTPKSIPHNPTSMVTGRG